METKVNQIKDYFENIKSSIRNKLKEDNVPFEELKDLHNQINDLLKEYQHLLEWAYKIIDSKGQDSKGQNVSQIKNLLDEIKGKNISDLISKLNKKGYDLIKAEKTDVTKGIENLIFRLLEQTRHGKREEVFYTLSRIYIVAEENFPKELLEPFKPIYSDSEFKVMIFSFLNGALSKITGNASNQDQNNE
jgi:translation elongation factor EF-1beta